MADSTPPPMKQIGRGLWKQWAFWCWGFGVDLEFTRSVRTPSPPTLSPAGRGRRATEAPRMKVLLPIFGEILSLLDRSEPLHPNPLPSGEMEGKRRGC